MDSTMITHKPESPRWLTIKAAGAIRATCPTIDGAKAESLAYEHAKQPTRESYLAILGYLCDHVSAIPVELRRAFIWNAALSVPAPR